MEINRQKTFVGFRVVRIIGYIILGLVAATLFGLAFGYFVMMLWNWLMPGLFGLANITFWQAFGIVLLARLIFGNIGHHRNKHDHMKRSKFSPWRNKWHSKCCEKDWKYYHEYWEKEGKDGFSKFVDEKKGNVE